MSSASPQGCPLPVLVVILDFLQASLPGLCCWLSLGNRFPTSIDFQAMYARLSFQGNLGELSSHYMAMESDGQLTHGTCTAFDKKPSLFCCLDLSSPQLHGPVPLQRLIFYKIILAGCGCPETRHNQPFFFFKSLLCSVKRNHISLFFFLCLKSLNWPFLQTFTE